VTKRERQFAIKEILAAEPVTSQGTLRSRLARRGCRVTQATLSRDLAELGVAWVATTNGGHYTIQPEEEVRSLRPLVGIEVTAIVSNESLILIHTVPGAAGTVAEYVDVLRHPEILGTVAGDNTVLVIPRSLRRTRALLAILRDHLIAGRKDSR
jgi:transcriptional regulator of arginine metabolism